MLFLGLRITEWIAVITFFSGGIYGLMKYYHLFASMNETLAELRMTMKEITMQNGDHESRITSLEEWRKAKRRVQNED